MAPAFSRRVVLASVVAVATVSALVFIGVSSTAFAQTNGGPPDQLFTDIVQMDRELTHLIDKVAQGQLTQGERTAAIVSIENQKHLMIRQFFNQPIEGLTFDNVFGPLNCIDINASLAKELIDSFDSKEAFRPRLNQIDRCKQQIGGQFQGTAYGVPLRDVFVDLDKMDVELVLADFFVRQGGISDKEIGAALEAAKKAKQDLEKKLHDANPPK